MLRVWGCIEGGGGGLIGCVVCFVGLGVLCGVVS